jgi:uncharacterized protein YecT (DUF1311 family)
MKSTSSAIRPLLLCTALALTSALPAVAQAQGQPQGGDPGLSKEFKPCMDRAEKTAGEAQIQQAFTCMDTERKKQDARVTRSYNSILGKLPEEGKKRLTAAQTAWQRFRDAQCAFYAEPEGPLPAKATNAECRLSITVGRANELESINSTINAQASSAPRTGPQANPSSPSATPSAGLPPATNMGGGSGLGLPPSGGLGSGLGTGGLTAPAPAPSK